MTYQLTPKHAKLWLPVVRELREYYEGKNDKFIKDCPLCGMADKITNQIYKQSGKWLINCLVCPWFIFEGDVCVRLVRNVEERRDDKSQDWCKQSIKRLKRWERKLKKIIKEEK